MPCVVEADSAVSPGEVCVKVRERSRRSLTCLSASEVYLDSLWSWRAFRRIGDKPSGSGRCVPAIDGLCSVTSALPDARAWTKLAASAYGWGEDDGDEIELEDMRRRLGLSEDDLEEEGMEAVSSLSGQQLTPLTARLTACGQLTW